MPPRAMPKPPKEAARQFVQGQVLNTARKAQGPVGTAACMAARSIIAFDFHLRTGVLNRTSGLLSSRFPQLEERSKRYAVLSRLELASRAACIAGLHTDKAKQKKYTDFVLGHLDQAFQVACRYPLLTDGIGYANGGRMLEEEVSKFGAEAGEVDADMLLNETSLLDNDGATIYEAKIETADEFDNRARKIKLDDIDSMRKNMPGGFFLNEVYLNRDKTNDLEAGDRAKFTATASDSDIREFDFSDPVTDPNVGLAGTPEAEGAAQEGTTSDQWQVQQKLMNQARLVDVFFEWEKENSDLIKKMKESESGEESIAAAETAESVMKALYGTNADGVVPRRERQNLNPEADAEEEAYIEGIERTKSYDRMPVKRQIYVDREVTPLFDEYKMHFFKLCNSLLEQSNRADYYLPVAKVLRELARCKECRSEFEYKTEFEARATQAHFAQALMMLKASGRYKLAEEFFDEAVDAGYGEPAEPNYDIMGATKTTYGENNDVVQFREKNQKLTTYYDENRAFLSKIAPNGHYIHWTTLHHTPGISIGPKGLLREQAWWTDHPHIQDMARIMKRYHPYIVQDLKRVLAMSEIEQLDKEIVIPSAYPRLLEDGKGKWDFLRFFEQKVYRPGPCNELPSVLRMLDELQCFHTTLPYTHHNSEECSIFKVSPGTRVSQHNGGSNLRVNVSMGLMGCEGAFMQLGGAGEVEWKEQEVLAFADGWDHAVDHRGTEDRWVITLGIFHPDLIENMHLYARAGTRTEWETITPKGQLQFADWQNESDEQISEMQAKLRAQTKQAREMAENVKMCAENAWIKRRLDTDPAYRDKLLKLRVEEMERRKQADEIEEQRREAEIAAERAAKHLNPYWHKARSERKDPDHAVQGPSAHLHANEPVLGE